MDDGEPGRQQNPINTYSAIDHRNHGGKAGNPASQ
jgi:hypothetical protein